MLSVFDVTAVLGHCYIWSKVVHKLPLQRPCKMLTHSCCSCAVVERMPAHEQVNASVEDIATLAEANARLVATARTNSRSVLAAERKRAQMLLHGVAVCFLLAPTAHCQMLWHFTCTSSALLQMGTCQ